MMQKLIIMICCLCSVLTMNAQSGLGEMQRAVGIVKGDSIQYDDVAFGSAGTYTVACRLKPEQLKAYAGCDVVGIRFALGMDMTKSAVVLETVGEENNMIGSTIVNQTVRFPVKGWNNVYFNAGKTYRITGEDDLFVGIQYTETETMVAAEQGGICIAGENYTGEGFYILGDFGQGNGWYSSNTGNLCVQLIVDVTNLPANDVVFSAITTGFKYKKNGEKIDFLAIANSSGRNPIHEVKYSLWIDDTKLGDYEGDGKGQEDMSIEGIVEIPENTPLGEHSFKVKMESLNGETFAEEHSVTENFVVYDKSFTRQKHYIEQYKDQESVYNSYTDKIMNQVVEESKAVLVNVYDNTSALHTEGSDDYTSRYAYTSPCFTVDRSYYPGERYVAYDVNDYALQVPEIMVAVIEQIVGEQDAYPAYATIDFDASYDEASHTIDLNVGGQLVENAKALFGDAALTVMITENGVKASQTVRNSFNMLTTNRNYLHQHVLRKYVSDPHGDIIDVTGSGYEKHYTVTLPETWKADDLEIVAIISKAETTPVTTLNLHDYDVNNCNSVKLKDVVSGITAPTLTLPEGRGAYSISGLRGSLRPGVKIVSGKKYVVR